MKTLVLTRADVERVATMELAVQAVEAAFGAFGRGEAEMPAKVYLPIEASGQAKCPYCGADYTLKD